MKGVLEWSVLILPRQVVRVTLDRENGWLCGHDPDLGILNNYIGNLEEVNHGHYLLDLLK